MIFFICLIGIITCLTVIKTLLVGFVNPYEQKKVLRNGGLFAIREIFY